MEVRIYYQDTDAGGVVYHANYLCYLERARTEFLREKGQSVRDMHSQGIIFPIVGLEVQFRAPARLDDLLEVDTQIVAVRHGSFVVAQQVKRKEDGKLLVEARVTLACVGVRMRPRRLPTELKELFSSLIA